MRKFFISIFSLEFLGEKFESHLLGGLSFGALFGRSFLWRALCSPFSLDPPTSQKNINKTKRRLSIGTGRSIWPEKNIFLGWPGWPAQMPYSYSNDWPWYSKFGWLVRYLVCGRWIVFAVLCPSWICRMHCSLRWLRVHRLTFALQWVHRSGSYILLAWLGSSRICPTRHEFWSSNIARLCSVVFQNCMLVGAGISCYRN